MRLVTFFITINKSFCLDGSRVLFKLKPHNAPLIETSWTTLKFNPELNYKSYSSFKSDSEDSQSSKKIAKKDKGAKILLIDENDRETAMYIQEAEKYARRKNLQLVELPVSHKGKQTYKLQKASELFQDKSDKSDNKISKKKKFIIKDVISEHDLQIKINSMMKYVERGQVVLCVIDLVEGRLDEKLSMFKKSVLNEYITQNVKSSKKLTLTFEKKSDGAVKSNEHLVKATDQSS